ncbi:hypothetical protein ONA70_35780, partial [Micromonospora yasonensis]|nr:hypothetical protein [Micromonospora yasonensis]
EAESGVELPPLPPIPPQLAPSDGLPRRAERPPGQWCREHGVIPPPGSFHGARGDERPTAGLGWHPILDGPREATG